MNVIDATNKFVDWGIKSGTFKDVINVLSGVITTLAGVVGGILGDLGNFIGFLSSGSTGV
jgi:hypothetical protein